MLAVIGLTLDVIGAVILALGLFRGTQPGTFGGEVRSADDVAADRASATVGVAFLAVGFIAQGANLVAPTEVRGWPLVVAGTLVLGVAIAAAAWRLLRRRLHP